MNKSLRPEQVKIPDIGQRDYGNRSSALLECIRRFPGQTENWYADVMTLNHICARKTTLQIIDDLVSDGLINDDKIGNSFHAYSINHNDNYIVFLQMIKEFQEIELNFLSYFDDNLSEFPDHDEWGLHEKIGMLKVIAVDVVGILLRLYRDMVHKYDHIGDVKILHGILGIVELMTAVRYDKEACLYWFDEDLDKLKREMENDSLRHLPHTEGVSCDRLIMRLVKFERDLNNKFVASSAEISNTNANDENLEVLRTTGQKFIDDYCN